MNKKTIFISLFSLILILLTPSLSAIEYSEVTEAIKEQYLTSLQKEEDYLGFDFSLFFRLLLSIIYLLLLDSIISVTYILELLLMNYILFQIPFFMTIIGQIIIGVLLASVNSKIGNLVYSLYNKWTDNHFQDFPKVGDFLQTMMVFCSIFSIWVGYRIVIPR
jgi:hypothetical protein